MLSLLLILQRDLFVNNSILYIFSLSSNCSSGPIKNLERLKNLLLTSVNFMYPKYLPSFNFICTLGSYIEERYG